MSTLRAAMLGVLLGASASAQPAPAPTPPPADERTLCLKQCTGSPRDATGPSLLACLRRCEGGALRPGAPDAGR